MTEFADVLSNLRASPRRFLVTGAAGFIGSHLTQALLELDQTVVGLDDFATGSRENVADVLRSVGPGKGARFRLMEGDIRDHSACSAAMRGIDVVLHQAALASVPRSMADPMATHSANVSGFVNILLAARNAQVDRVVYASSSSVYGDDVSDVKMEGRIGRPLSPYAASKLMDEIYADTLGRTHAVSSVGLRYFNVFGARQDPAGAYAAVVPRWIEALLRQEPCVVFGDGRASRDFCFVDNVVQANLLAACLPAARLSDRIFNVGCGVRTTLLELFEIIRRSVSFHQPTASETALTFAAPRPGDVLHSLASIERARSMLGYAPSHDVRRGMDETVLGYAARALHAPPSEPSCPATIPATAGAS